MSLTNIFLPIRLLLNDDLATMHHGNLLPVPTENQQDQPTVNLNDPLATWISSAVSSAGRHFEHYIRAWDSPYRSGVTYQEIYGIAHTEKKQKVRN